MIVTKLLLISLTLALFATKALGLSSWVFQNPSNIYLVNVTSSPSSVRFANQFCVVATAGGENQLLFFSFNQTTNAIGTQVLHYETNANAGPALVEVISTSSTVAYAYATMPQVSTLLVYQLSGTSVSSAGTVSISNPASQLLLDPKYPWLYIIQTGAVRLLNISISASPSLISTVTTSQAFVPIGVNSAVLNGSQLIIGDSSGATSGIVVLDYSSSPTLVPTVKRMQNLNGWKVRSVIMDPTGSFFGVTRANSTTNTFMPGYALYNYGLSYLNNSMLSSIPYYNPGVDMMFFNGTMLALARTETNNVTMISSYICSTNPLLTSCSAFPGQIALPRDTPDLNASSWTWVGNRVFIASVSTNTIYSFSVSLTLFDSAVDIGSLIKSSDYYQKSNYTMGSYSRLPQLRLVQGSTFFRLDASQTSSSLTPSNLDAVDGYKRLAYNKIMLYVVSNSSTTEDFQVYNSTTGTWTSALSFSQTDLYNGNVRLTPRASVKSLCQSAASTTTAFPYAASVTLQATDIWGRSFSTPQNFSYTVTCCSALASAVNYTVDPLTGQCTLPIAGMYTLSDGVTIAPCPQGTFNPNFGAGQGSAVCLGCPNGGTTAQSGSTSVSQCICSNCIMTSTLTSSSDGTHLVYYWPINSAVAAQSAVFYTVKIKGEGPAYIVLSTSSSAPTNNSVISDASNAYYQIAIGESGNSVITVTNVSTSGMISQTLNGSATSYSQIAQKAISADYWTTVWVYYYNGIVQVGLLNPALADNTPGLVAGSNIYTIAQNVLGTLPSNLTPQPYVTAAFKPASSAALITNIGLGFASTNSVSYVDGYVLSSADFFNNIVIQKPSPLMLSASFPSLKYDEFRYTVLPGSSFFAICTTAGGGVNATWISPSLMQYNFGGANTQANSGVLGVLFDIVYSPSLSTPQSSWTSIRSFNGSLLNSNQIYLKALVPQSQISASAVQLQFTVTSTAARTPISPVTSILNISVPAIPTNYGLHMGSWKLENVSSTPSLRCQAAGFGYSDGFFVFGGITPDELTYFNDMYMYNTTTKSWTLLSATTPRPSAVALTSFGYIPALGVAVLYGGYGSSAPLFKTSLWVYSPVNNQFASATVYCSNTPSNCLNDKANFGQFAVLGDNATMLLFGGASSTADSNQLYSYKNGNWVYLNSATANQGSAAISVSSGLYSSSAASIPSGRQMHSFVPSRSNGALLFGGQHLYNSGILLNDVWRYNSATNMWTLLANVISEANYVAPPSPMRFLNSLTYAPYPRNLSAAVSDGFGNFYIFGGISNNIGAQNDLWLFNENLNQWVLLSGTADGTTRDSSINYYSVGVNVSSSLNVPPPGSGELLFIRPISSDGRYYTLYLVKTCQPTQVATQVWSRNVYVQQSTPVFVSSSLAIDLSFNTFVVINATDLNIVAIDSAQSEVVITPLPNNIGVFKNLSSSSILTSWTMADLSAGLQIGFYPNLTSVINTQSTGNSDTAYNGSVGLNIQTSYASSNVSFTIKASCSIPNTVLPYCSCASGYTLNSAGSCAAVQGSSPSSSSAASVNIIIIAASAGGAACVVAALLVGAVVMRSRKKKREFMLEEERLRQIKQMNPESATVTKTHEFGDINLPLQLPSSASVVGQSYAFISPTTSSNYSHNEYGKKFNGQSMAGTGQLLSAPTINLNTMESAHNTIDELDPYNMKTQVVTARPVIAFPAFLAVNSSSGMRKIEKIAEGGFAVLYKGQLLDTTIADGAYQKLYVALKSFKFKSPKKPKAKKGGNDDKEEAAAAAAKEAVEEGTTVVLPPSEDAIADMENEASVMYSLQCCPNIVRLIAVSKEPELMLAMKLYLDSVGHTLHSSKSQHYAKAVMFAKGSHAQLGAIFSYDLCNAVLAMHSTGIVHLDIKPSNLLLEAVRPESNITGFPYRAVLCDFGLARVVNETNAVKGRRKNFATGVSINYAAPEAFSLVRFMDGGSTLGAESLQKLDIYSVSASIYEIMTREIPFESLSLKEMEECLAKGSRPPMHYFNPNNLPMPVFNVRTGTFSPAVPDSQKLGFHDDDNAPKPPKFTVTSQKDVVLLFEFSKIIQQGWAQFSDARPDIAVVYDAVCAAIQQYAASP